MEDAIKKMKDGFVLDLTQKEKRWFIEQVESIQSHAPDGRNYTNAQYVLLQQDHQAHIGKVSHLRDHYEAKVQKEINFRENEREAGGYHQMDRFRSLERQHVYQDVVKDLDSLINK